MSEAAFRRYPRKQIAELRPYVPGEDLNGVSISSADEEAGSPKLGDMIARNPKNHADQWLVAAQYFADNFEALASEGQQAWFMPKLNELEAEIVRLRTALGEMIEISERNSEAGLMLIAIRKCAQHALANEEMIGASYESDEGLMSETLETAQQLINARAEIASLRDDLGEALVRESNLLALIERARPYVEYCAESRGSDGAAAALGEIDRLRSENDLIAVQQWGVELRRLRAILDQLRKLFGHIEGINDERDSVPILLEARRIVALADEKPEFAIDKLASADEWLANKEGK